MDFDADRDHRGAEDAFVAALVELHRRKERTSRVQTRGDTYARVLQHFERRGERLRGERLVTEELLGRLLSSTRALPPAPVQQELAIAGPLGGIAAGRFRIVNQTQTPVSGAFAVGDPLEGSWRPRLRFNPERPRLEPSRAALVRVEADLRDAPGPGRVTLPIECRSGGHRDRLWLEITAFDPREVGG